MPDLKNVVINGVLCYLASARHTHTDLAMTNICQSFYNSEKIAEAKELLFSFSSDNAVRRRGEGKTKADLTDIITLFRKMEENNEQLPKFLTDDFRTLPPASGYEVIAEHVVNLMLEISALREQVEKLQKSEVPDNDMVDLREEIHDIKTMLLQKCVSDNLVSATASNVLPINSSKSDDTGNSYFPS